MIGIMETLNQALGNEELKAISRRIGADERLTATAMETSLPVLIGALRHNASHGEADEIFQAITRDHDGSALDNMESFLSHSDQGGGEGILRHLLGSRKQAVENRLGMASGLDSGSMAKLLSILAPIVMGAIGKAQNSGRFGSEGLNDFLNQESMEVEQRNPGAASTLSLLFDTDNDGDVDLSDLASHGMRLLRRFMH